MLPKINLDDEIFSEILENSIKQIPKYAPEWTDFNPHDPGITFLELFAWMKEMQQYRMNRTGNDTRRKFLKLIGMKPYLRKAAKVNIELETDGENLMLPKGTPFYAGTIPFETEREAFASAAKVRTGFSETGAHRISFPENVLPESGKMKFYIFGKEPRHGNAFYICLDAPVTEGKVLSLYLDIFQSYELQRNPVKEGFLPLANLQWQFLSEEGWRNAEVISDETHGMIESGEVCLRLHGEMQADEKGDYLIRTVFQSGSFDVAPLLTGIGCNSVRLIQQQTMADFRDLTCSAAEELRMQQSYTEVIGENRLLVKEGKYWRETREQDIVWPATVRILSSREDFSFYKILGEGDGFPYQQFRVEMDDLTAGGFAIMTEERPGCFAEWFQVDDFDLSEPEDRHYFFDEETGDVFFGDCERGMAPEGEILIVRCVLSKNADGNVKAGSIQRTDDRCCNIRIHHRRNATGGMTKESIGACFERFLRESRAVERAVTLSDYETLVRQTPGLMIRSCRAFSAAEMPNKDGSIEENCVNIVVQPFSMEFASKLSKPYIENIYRQLEHRQLICTKANILSPEYIGITIFAEISVKSYYRNAEEMIRDVVSDFFKGNTEKFGSTVRYSTVYGLIDSLDCVSEIRSLVLDGHGRNIGRNVIGDVILPQNGIAYLKETEYVLTASE